MNHRERLLELGSFIKATTLKPSPHLQNCSTELRSTSACCVLAQRSLTNSHPCQGTRTPLDNKLRSSLKHYALFHLPRSLLIECSSSGSSPNTQTWPAPSLCPWTFTHAILLPYCIRWKEIHTGHLRAGHMRPSSPSTPSTWFSLLFAFPSPSPFPSKCFGCRNQWIIFREVPKGSALCINHWVEIIPLPNAEFNFAIVRLTLSPF